MNVTPTRLPDVLLVEPRVFTDDRGLFFESYHAQRFAAHGLPEHFVQDNVSVSRRNVLRGLHFQHPFPQGKLVSAVRGTIFDVAVDIRDGSPTFMQWVGVELSGENKRQLYVPPGFAHGFLVTSDEATVSYKCTELYHPETEQSLAWNDPQIGIEWPTKVAVLSPKDRAAPRLADIPRESRPSVTPRS